MTWRPPAVGRAYSQLLAAVAGANLPGEVELTSHWPLVGTATQRLLIVGQAVYGWMPNWRPADIATERRRFEVMRSTQAVCYERPDPMDWIAEHRVRNSPFWRCVRHLVERRYRETTAEWYSHVAWANIYPVARNDIKGNPEGALRDYQRPQAAALLSAVADALNPEAVIVFGGTYWWDIASDIGFVAARPAPRPLLTSGTREGTPWVAGWHPGGAQRRGWNANQYAAIIDSELS